MACQGKPLTSLDDDEWPIIPPSSWNRTWQWNMYGVTRNSVCGRSKMLTSTCSPRLTREVDLVHSGDCERAEHGGHRGHDGAATEQGECQSGEEPSPHGEPLYK
jgi:hypothetical protein